MVTPSLRNLHDSIKQAAKSNQRTTKQTRRRKTQPHMTGRLSKKRSPHEERSAAGNSKRDKTGHRAAETRVHDESRDQESDRERPGAGRARGVSFDKKAYILEFEQKGLKKKTRAPRVETRHQAAHQLEQASGARSTKGEEGFKEGGLQQARCR